MKEGPRSPRGRGRPAFQRHLAAAGALVLLGLANMWGWLDPDRLPPYDFAGYVTVVQDVHDQVMRYGGMPVWNQKWFSGTTEFMSHFKERLILPLAALFGAFRGTQLAVFLLRVAAGLVMYAAFARYFRAPAVGLICGYAYAFCMSASYSSENVDVMLSFVLVPLIFICACETFRGRRAGAAVALGVLIACQFSTNLVHSLVTPLMVALVVILRPWQRTRGLDNPLVDAALARRWAGLLALALLFFLLFAASQIAWFASDQQNHSPHQLEYVERSLRRFSEPSPFTLVNRANWLGDWLVAHRPLHMTLFPEEPLRNQRHYLGFVALTICLAGWFAARGDRVLRRSYQLFSLLFLLQWSVAMGPHSLLWQVARSFHWPQNLDAPITRLLSFCALLCGAAAVALWLRARRRLNSRVELVLALGLLLLFVVHPMLPLLRESLSFLAHFRSPGKFMDLLPFPFYATFGVGLVALQRKLPGPRARQAFLAAVLLLVVVDFWPGRAAFLRGSDHGPVREFREIVAQLPAGEDQGRLAFHVFESPTLWVESSFVAVNAPVNAAWGWLRWQAGWHTQPFLENAFSWLDEELGPQGRVKHRGLGSVLSRIGRFRYLLDEFRNERKRELDSSWKLLASNERFALWEQESVLPMAYGYREYVVTLGDNYRPAGTTTDRAHRRGMAVVAGGDTLEAVPMPLLQGASLVVGLSESALPGSTLESDSPRVRPLRDKLMSPAQPSFMERFRHFFESRPPRSLVPVRYRRPAPERIRLEIDAGEEPAVVFVAESHHPWWRVDLDGVPAPLLRAQMAFMAVRVGPGPHVVEMRLEPPLAVRVADGTTALCWFGLVGAALAAGLHTAWRRFRQR